MKTLDRYILRELAFPFFIALVGFLIFILLNLILGLRDFMLDRAIGLWTILKILAYQLPFFLVLSLPVATLFAIFLSLGRLAHDREIVALQASGLSLKRIVLPILIVSLLISGFDLFLNDRLVPWANYRYQGLIRQLILRRATPRIQDDTFFKDSEGRFFYVRRYDRGSGRLEGIMVYDLEGAEYLPQLGGRYPKVIVAEEGSWDREVWRLYEGVIHKYDDRGHLEYALRFDSLEIDVGEGLERLFLTSRTPREMSLGELARKIKVLRESGLRAEGLIVEYHSKISIPLAGFVFALFGAPLSLIFSTRSRAAGVVLGVLFVGLFQGSLIWSETLGKRGIIPPAISAWLPNLVFGGLGLILFLIMDRVSQLDLRERLRRLFRFYSILGLSALFFLIPISGGGLAEGPSIPRPRLEVTADRLTISEDWSAVSAEGDVTVKYGESMIRARRIELSQIGQIWELHAAEEVELSAGELAAWGEELRAELEQDKAGSLTLRRAELVHFSAEDRAGSLRYQGGRAVFFFGGELERVKLFAGAEISYLGGRLAAEEIEIAKLEGEEVWLAEAQGGVILEEGQITSAKRLTLKFRAAPEFRAESAGVEAFSGEGRFINARGEEHTLRYRGEKATLSFDEGNRVEFLDISGGAFTTCSCRERIEREAYCITAERVLIFGDDLLVATNITMRAFRFPVFWAPLYLVPLKEERESPFLPEVGRSASRGWFAKWRLPFILDERNYGFILLDYFNRHRQLGTGVELRYDLWGSSGSLRLYRLLGPLGLGLFEFALSERTELPSGVRFTLTTNYRTTGTLEAEAAGEQMWMGYRAIIAGSRAGWDWNLTFSQDRYLREPKGEEVRYRSLERLPELVVNHEGWRLGPFSSSLGLSFGRYREMKLGATEPEEGTRFSGTVRLGLEEISLHEGRLKLRSGGSYRLSFYGPMEVETLAVSSGLTILPLEGLSLSLAHSYRLVRGRSPFAFDRESEANRLNLQGKWTLPELPGLQGGLSTAYDLVRGRFSPLTLSLSHHRGPSRTALSLSYDLNQGRLRRVTLQEALAGAGWTFSAEGGYDFFNERFSDLIAKLSLGRLRLGLRYDLNRLSPKRANAELSWSWEFGKEGEEWRLSLAGEYDFGLGTLSTFRYELVRSFCRKCWEIGLIGERGRVWLRARINAFPTVALKYSPTDQKLTFGG